MNSAASTALRAAKEALRVEVKKKLLSMSKDEKIRQTKLITEKLLNYERFKNSHRISLYLSTEHEVQTHGILEQILNMGKECFVPKYDPNSQHMYMVKLHSTDDLPKLSLMNWSNGQKVEDSIRDDALVAGGLDLMVIPGLAFDKRGGRIGTGQGYYDVYIDQCLHDPHGRPYLIGLAFQEQILHSIPMDEHDFVADDILYPDK
ncbi:5-formyltetrahydrofolate cyclo-ligase-like [Limulus polyphemus]|uniref:5-formyltetrahydrofolate cyclo-ligase n=1 Tax=Limulus polyphemus TaxID=6850 RepID=A0ABM1BBF2_LIMPO|nr:5-formyltetrahydrofolate cyclo-ligase-like [Limulus polyphemus]